MSGRNVGIFLDRDGTINDEVDFLTTPDELHLIDGSDKAISEANRLGAKVFVVTNQSGIARGLLSEERLHRIHARLVGDLKERGARIDAIYYCPHHPEVGNSRYRKDCDCRKPKTGMLERAAREHHIDLARSFVIGDRMIDVQTALAAGSTPVLVLTGYGKDELELCRTHGIPVEHVSVNLEEAMRVVKQALTHAEKQIQ